MAENTILTVPKDHLQLIYDDEPMEVFLDNGNIREPLERGIAYEFCDLDRWCMPNCNPAIKSKIELSSNLVDVLFTGEEYIHLSPGKPFLMEPSDPFYETVEAHFSRRGLRYIKDRNKILFRSIPKQHPNHT